MSTFIDYLFKTTDLDRAKQAIDELRTAGLLNSNTGPQNMLGDPITDTEGNLVLRATKGRAAFSYTDPDNGENVDVPAVGDPGYWYIAIRSEVPEINQPVDPTAFGLETCSPEESAQVLGVWA